MRSRRARRLLLCSGEGPSTSSRTSAFTDEVSSKPWIAPMCGWFSEASSWASRWKRARRSGSAAKSSRQDLQRDVAIQPRVARAVDLAHAAGAERRQNLVRTDASAAGKRHSPRPVGRNGATISHRSRRRSTQNSQNPQNQYVQDWSQTCTGLVSKPAARGWPRTGARSGAERTAVTGAFVASTRAGCSRTGPARAGFETSSSNSAGPALIVVSLGCVFHHSTRLAPDPRAQ